MTKLSADMFQAIIGSLRSDKSRRSNEKRSRPRVGLRCSLEIAFGNTPSPAARKAVVWVRDVSADGLGLVAQQAFQPGVEFVASFTRFDREPLHVLYTVAHCKSLAKGLYSVGASLVRVLPAEGSTKSVKPTLKQAKSAAA